MRDYRNVITKEITFDMAHRLSFHKGKCANVHGHTYKLQVTVCDTHLCQHPEERVNMVVDFGTLSRHLKEVAEYYDHKIVLCTKNDMINITLAHYLKDMNLEVIESDTEPTVENMAWDIYKMLADKYDIEAIKLWETPTSFTELRYEK